MILGHCKLRRSAKSITRRNRQSIAKEPFRSGGSCDEAPTAVGATELGHRSHVRGKRPRGIFEQLINANHARWSISQGMRGHFYVTNRFVQNCIHLNWKPMFISIQLNSGQDAFYYQLFVEKDERLSFPTVQQLFEQSFLASDIKLKEVPSCLIIQMPRFGKNFKMYPRILPSQVLDVTDVIEGCK